MPRPVAHLANLDGIEATQMITAGDTHARVLMLTTFDDDDYVYGALASPVPAAALRR